MVKKLFVGIAFSSLLATTGWAATSSPTLIVTPPQPKWSDLTIQQKVILAPLSDDWDSLEYYRQKKWLGIAAGFPGMTPEEQRRIQGQMQEWGKLSSEQRQTARENYKATSQLPADKKEELKRKWEEYSALPTEEKEKIKQQASNSGSPVPKLPRVLAPVPLTPLPQTPPITAAPPLLPTNDTSPAAASQTAADPAAKP